MAGGTDPKVDFYRKASLNRDAINAAARAFVGAPDSAVVTFRYTNEDLREVIVEWEEP